MMVRHGSAWAAKINGNAYLDFLRNNPDLEKITLTRPQMEAIIRDLCEYSDRHAEATAWAEQATRSAARIAMLERAIRAVCCALENLEHDGVRAASARTLRRALTDGQEDRCKPAYGAHDEKTRNRSDECTDACGVAYSVNDGHQEEGR